MRYVGFYNDVKQGYFTSDKSNLPSIAALSRNDDKALQIMMAQYLDGGHQLGSKLGWSNDAFKPEIRTSLETMTDGDWIWPGDAAYYCKIYDIVPPNAEFVKYVIEHDGKCPTPDPTSLDYIEQNWFKRPLERSGPESASQSAAADRD
jgi:hypothetical protein